MQLDELSQRLVSSSFPKLSGNVYCIGRNYSEHIKELKNEIPSEPVVFLKAPSSLRLLTEGGIACQGESFHHEIEIVLLVGKHCKMGTKASEANIGGMTLGLDLTRRELQNELKAKGLPWTLAKSFQGSAILHPIQAKPEALAIDFSLSVNGELRQRGNSQDMIFNFEAILNFLLKYQDLHPGDLIFTGTPSGVAGFKEGDRFHMHSAALKIDASGVL